MSRLRSIAETLMLLLVLAAAVWTATQHWQPVRVTGGSMQPALSEGDLVLVDKRGRAGSGRIALLESPRHGPVLHRIVSVGPDGSVVTKGDANKVTDFDSLPATSVVGPVVAVVPVGRWIARWRGNAPYATMTAQQNSSR